MNIKEQLKKEQLKKEIKEKQDELRDMVDDDHNSNTWGIIAFICAFVIPFLGIIFAFVSIAKKEKDIAWPIAALIVSVISWFIGMLILM